MIRITRTLLTVLALLAGLIGIPVGVFAAPVTWSLNDVQFGDGGSAFGTFTYDASANLFSNISITTTAGTIRGGDVYSFPALGTPTLLDFLDFNFPTELPVVGVSDRSAFFLASAMTDLGGTINVTAALEFTCGTPGCGNTPSIDLRQAVRSGFITSVPEPGTLALLIVAIATLGLGRRRAA